MKKIVITIIILSSILSCTKKEIITIRLNQNQIIPSGEWISSSDSLSGISIRKDRMAFYSNNTFNGEDVFTYNIIDSIKIDNKKKTIIGTYLIAKGIDDTSNYKITIRDKKNISLELKDGRTEKYKLQKK